MMKEKDLIPRPFRRGRCSKCHSDDYKKDDTLCPACESFVSQDYGTQRFQLIDSKEMKKAADKIAVQQFMTPAEALTESPFDGRRRLQVVFKKARLTRLQQQVMMHLFIQGEDFSKISASLGISKTSAANLMCRAIKNLEKWCKPALLMRGKEFSNGEIPESELPELFRPKNCRLKSFNLENLKDIRKQMAGSELRRITFGRICPRCKDRVFKADRNYLYCMNCIWNSDQEN